MQFSGLTSDIAANIPSFLEMSRPPVASTMPGISDSFRGAKSPRYSSLGLFTSRQLSLMDDGNAICFNYYRHSPHSVVGLRRRTADSRARHHLLAGGRSIARSLGWSASPKWTLRG